MWTEADIPSLAGKTALVTGANSGLGLETARALAARGAQVVLACRSQAKAEQAMQQIRARVPDVHLAFLELDLADLACVSAAAQAFRARHGRLDILCNNAGLMGLPYSKTRDGFETLFGTNHLGPFAFTGLLMDVIRATPGARVVTLASLAHRRGRLPLDDLHWERRRYDKAGAYGQSKLANLMFALELDRRFRRTGIAALSTAAHPGYSATNVVYARDARPSISRSLWHAMARAGNAILAQPAAMGALPTLYAATAADARGGEYFGPGGFVEFRGPPVRVQPARQARDEALAADLWRRSEQMTGVRYLS